MLPLKGKALTIIIKCFIVDFGISYGQEKADGKPMILATKSDDQNHLPYGGSQTKTMSTDLLQSLGAKIDSSREWIQGLVLSLGRI